MNNVSQTIIDGRNSRTVRGRISFNVQLQIISIRVEPYQFLITEKIASMNKLNNIGPSTDPCGTPYNKLTDFDLTLSILITNDQVDM